MTPRTVKTTILAAALAVLSVCAAPARAYDPVTDPSLPACGWEPHVQGGDSAEVTKNDALAYLAARMQTVKTGLDSSIHANALSTYHKAVLADYDAGIACLMLDLDTPRCSGREEWVFDVVARALIDEAPDGLLPKGYTKSQMRGWLVRKVRKDPSIVPDRIDPFTAEEWDDLSVRNKTMHMVAHAVRLMAEAKLSSPVPHNKDYVYVEGYTCRDFILAAREFARRTFAE